MNTYTQTSNPVTHIYVNNGHTETEQLNWSATDVQELKHGMLLLAFEELRDNRRSRAMKVEAWEWLMIDADDQLDNPFSAENCCVDLGMDIKAIRSFVRDLKATGVIKL
ncbi:hypothetical protein [Psychromonas aquimarina]|uniref:hypothetical protein n=1 Tax=Psychromonas aquimarina TaxID=444919 RepID=UPI000491EA1D|nr:hypothetical protein [Psychromonas aquimarina]